MQFDLPTAAGTRMQAAQFTSAQAVVFLFLATDCPISNRYAPVLHELEKEFRPRGVVFLGVFSDAAVGSAEVRNHMREFGLEMPALMDGAATLARRTGARVTPEAAVVSEAGDVVYRGRIDDRYVDWGKTRPEAGRQDLRLAIEAVLAHRPVPQAVTKALGCALPGAGR